MIYFVWLIDAENEGLITSSKGISPSYMLPDLHSYDPKELVGATVFVLLRGNKGDVLLKKLFIEKIEKNTDDTTFFPNFYVLTIDYFQSFRITQNYKSGKESFLCQRTSNIPLGLHKISLPIVESIYKIIESHISIRLNKPNFTKTASSISAKLNSLTSKQIAIYLYKKIVKQYSLDEIWRNRSITNPFVTFAVFLLSYCRTKDNNTIEKYLKSFSMNLFKLENNTISYGVIPNVDIDFENINPLELQTRHFIASANIHNIEETVSKTEDAEKRHQSILRDICEFLIQNHIQPLQSKSIDLLVRNTKGNLIFEIKSTTDDNIFSQIGKGNLQLAIYNHVLQTEGIVVYKRFLVLESDRDDGFHHYITTINKTLGIETLFYNKSLEWPNRLNPNPFINSIK